MHSVTRISGAVALAIGLGGCGTLYKLDVVAFSEPDYEIGKTYVVLSGDPNVSVDSPEFNQYADQVERALAAKGYERVGEDELSTAALGIYLTTGISDPSKRYHEVKTGVYEAPYALENQTAITRSGTNSSGGQSGGQPTPVPIPREQMLAGYEKAGFATTVYTKHLNMTAVDLQQYMQDIAKSGDAAATPKEVWSIEIETTGKPSNLAEVIPVMLAAGQPYVADSTEDVVRIKLSESDKRIDNIRGK
jgi:hypothetical protein